MQVHGYTESGSISATIDDTFMTVPDDMGNRHRQMIAEWEAGGNTIPAYVPLPSPPVDPETLVREAMFKDFLERTIKDNTAPKALKDAALAVRAHK